MATSGAINYRDSFEYPDLTRIHGEPTFETIKVVEDELKANAQTVYSSLGGGQHGHFGLVITPFEYSRISNIPFQSPNAPTPCIVAAGETLQEAQARLHQHNTNVKKFKNVPESKRHYSNNW